MLISKNTILLRDKIQECVLQFPHTDGHKKILNRKGEERQEYKEVKHGQYIDEKRLRSSLNQLFQCGKKPSEKEIELIVAKEMKLFKKEQTPLPPPKCDYINSNILHKLELFQEKKQTKSNVDRLKAS